MSLGLKIVCTGGSGTIGQFLPESVIRLKTRLEDSVEARVAELKALSLGAFALIHLAALTSVAQADKDPSLARGMNVEGSVKWLEAASRVGCERFVHVSTSHVFKPTREKVFLATDRPSDATAVYGRTKAEAEVALLSLAPSLKTQVIVARVFSVTSAKMRDGFLFPELLRRTRERDFKPLPGHQNVRDFIDAQVAAKQLMQLATATQLSRSIYHLSSGQPKSVRQLAEEVLRSGGVDPISAESMFPPAAEPENYLISYPSKLEEHT